MSAVHPLLLTVLGGLQDENEVIRAEYKSRLKKILDNQSQTMPPQLFSSLIARFCESGLALLQSQDSREKLGGLTIVDCLLDINDDDAHRRIEIANHLRKFLENEKKSDYDPLFLRVAAECVGHLARLASTTETELLQNFYVNNSITWLTDTRHEVRRLASVLVLKEIAVSAPTLLYVRRKQFFYNAIWGVLSDSRPIIRFAAAEALHATLVMISQRDFAADEYYRKALVEMDAGLKETSVGSNPPSSDKVHGCLLILSTLLSLEKHHTTFLVNALKANQRDFIDLCSDVIKKRDYPQMTTAAATIAFASNKFVAVAGHTSPVSNYASGGVNDRLIRLAVIALIPSLAMFNSILFVFGNMGSVPVASFCIQHLLCVASSSSSSSSASVNLGIGFGVPMSPSSYTLNSVTSSTGLMSMHMQLMSGGSSEKSLAFIALGRLFVATDVSFMRSNVSLIEDILMVVLSAFTCHPFCEESLIALSVLISVSPSSRRKIDVSFIDAAFRGGGLNSALIFTLMAIVTYCSRSSGSHARMSLLTHIIALLIAHGKAFSLVSGAIMSSQDGTSSESIDAPTTGIATAAASAAEAAEIVVLGKRADSKTQIKLQDEANSRKDDRKQSGTKTGESGSVGSEVDAKSRLRPKSPTPSASPAKQTTVDRITTTAKPESTTPKSSGVGGFIGRMFASVKELSSSTPTAAGNSGVVMMPVDTGQSSAAATAAAVAMAYASSNAASSSSSSSSTASGATGFVDDDGRGARMIHNIVLALRTLGSFEFIVDIEDDSEVTKRRSGLSGHIRRMQSASLTVLLKSSNTTSSSVESLDNAALTFYKELAEIRFRHLHLLRVVRDCALPFLDSPNPAIRKEAALTCTVVLNKVVASIDEFSFYNSYFFAHFSDRKNESKSLEMASVVGSDDDPIVSNLVLLAKQMLDRLLLLGVGDDNEIIRASIFRSLLMRPSLDRLLSQSENVSCLIEGLNDESIEVRISATSVLSRVAHYDTTHVLPLVRQTMIKLIRQIENATVPVRRHHDNSRFKLEVMQLLQALVEGTDSLILPHVDIILRPVIGVLYSYSQEGKPFYNNKTAITSFDSHFTIGISDRETSTTQDEIISRQSSTDEIRPSSSSFSTSLGSPSNALSNPSGQHGWMLASSSVAAAALSTIGILATICPDAIVRNLHLIMQKLIEPIVYIRRQANTEAVSEWRVGPSFNMSGSATAAVLVASSNSNMAFARTKALDSVLEGTINTSHLTSNLASAATAAASALGIGGEYSFPITLDIQEVAVVALGKVVSSLGLAVVPYIIFPDLFQSLVLLIQKAGMSENDEEIDMEDYDFEEYIEQDDDLDDSGGKYSVSNRRSDSETSDVVSNRSQNRSMGFKKIFKKSSANRTMSSKALSQVHAVLNATGAEACTWKSLRLEAIRTIGLLGAVDTNRLQGFLTSVTSQVSDLKNSDLVDTSSRLLLMMRKFSDAHDGQNNLSGDEGNQQRLLENEDTDDDELTQLDKYYLQVAASSLSSILEDPSLSTYHQVTANVCLRIIRILGHHSKTQLEVFIRGIIAAFRRADPKGGLRETLLEHIAMIVMVVRGQIKSHLTSVLRLVVDFFFSHLEACLRIVQALYRTLSIQEFNVVLREVLPCMFEIIQDEPLQFAEDSVQLQSGLPMSPTLLSGSGSGGDSKPLRKTRRILQTLRYIHNTLGEYKRTIIPAILRVLEQSDARIDIRKDSIFTLLLITKDDPDLPEFASRIIHPILRLITVQEQSLLAFSFVALSCMVCRLTVGYVPYIIPVRRKIQSLREQLRDQLRSLSSIEEYESYVSRLLKMRPLPPEPEVTKVASEEESREEAMLNAASVRLPTEDVVVKRLALEAAWDLSGRTTASDLEEWMRRFSVELIRQSSSPILRPCHVVAEVYQPLADQMFNAAFVSMWDELFVDEQMDIVDDIPVIASLETALQAPLLPARITHTLLNFAEFMEMQDKTLPLDIAILGRQTERAHMYAKCIHYREMEFNAEPSAETIRALITSNNQLGMPEAAAGVLAVIRNRYPSIKVDPSWLETLGRWQDAYTAYTEEALGHLVSNPADLPFDHENWIIAELGRLRCLQALGEFGDLHEMSKRLFIQFKSRVPPSEQESSSPTAYKVTNARALPEVPEIPIHPLMPKWFIETRSLAATASWALSDWDSMDQFTNADDDELFQSSVSADESRKRSASVIKSGGLQQVFAGPNAQPSQQIAVVTNSDPFGEGISSFVVTRSTATTQTLSQSGGTFNGTVSSLLIGELPPFLRLLLVRAILMVRRGDLDEGEKAIIELRQHVAKIVSWSLNDISVSDSQSNDANPSSRSTSTSSSGGRHSSGHGLVIAQILSEFEELIQFKRSMDGFVRQFNQHHELVSDSDDGKKKDRKISSRMMFDKTAGRRSEAKVTGTLARSKSLASRGFLARGNDRFHDTYFHFLTHLLVNEPQENETLTEAVDANPMMLLSSWNLCGKKESETLSNSEVLHILSDPLVEFVQQRSQSSKFGRSSVLQRSTETSEEIIATLLMDSRKRAHNLLEKWSKRLSWCPQTPSVLRRLLSIRSLTFLPVDMAPEWLSLADICRQQGMFNMCQIVLDRLGVSNVSPPADPSIVDFVGCDYLKDPKDTASASRGSITVDARTLFCAYRLYWDQCMSYGRVRLSSRSFDIIEEKAEHIPSKQYGFMLMWKFAEKIRVMTEAGRHSNSTISTPTEDRISLASMIRDPLQPMKQDAQASIVDCLKSLRVKSLLTLASWSKTSGLSVASCQAYLSRGNQPTSKVLLQLNSTQSTGTDATQTNLLKNVLYFLDQAAIEEQSSAEIWHELGVYNYYLLGSLRKDKESQKGKHAKSASGQSTYADRDDDNTMQIALASIQSFIKSIKLLQAGQESQSPTAQHSMRVQDCLRLLTLWFETVDGSSADNANETIKAKIKPRQEIFKTLSDELTVSVNTETWLMVLPQLIARLRVVGKTDVHRMNQREIDDDRKKQQNLAYLLLKVLLDLASKHPQAVIFPVIVTNKSIGSSLLLQDDSQDDPRQSQSKDSLSQKLMTRLVDEISSKFSALVEDAQLVSTELEKVAISRHERWHEGLELAAQAYLDSRIGGGFDAADLNDESKTRDRRRGGMLDKLDELYADFQDGIGDSDDLLAISASDSPDSQNGLLLRDIAFSHAFGRELHEGFKWIDKYKEFMRQSKSEKNKAVASSYHSASVNALHQAWDIFHAVFRRISKLLESLQVIHLKHVSCRLVDVRDLSLAVPGSYNISQSGSSDSQSITRIKSFLCNVDVIQSKQRPRRMSMLGSDGIVYRFLLKGHEDLRQDERVMQLFGLVNSLLSSASSQTASSIGLTSDYDSDSSTVAMSLPNPAMRSGLAIRRYSVLPLSDNSGIIGWVENCDTMNQLVKYYREPRAIKVTIENRIMQQLASPINQQNPGPPNAEFDKLSIAQKVDIFNSVHSQTKGSDLANILWLRSKNSESWIEKRSVFAVSLAVNSIVGYILGLGDRHPSNIMIHKDSGKCVHIDFGDCFEVAMLRTKFPETVPFRLTRMLIQALGVGAVEGGIFRCTCERIMRLLRDRDNSESVTAMLEAFVFDPLFSWENEAIGNQKIPSDDNEEGKKLDDGAVGNMVAQFQEGDGNEQKQVVQAAGKQADKDDDDTDYGTNQKALSVLARIHTKLSGTDFDQVRQNGKKQKFSAKTIGFSSTATSKTPHSFEGIGSSDVAEESTSMSPEQQAIKLIQQATDPHNLCRLFIGWCPFW